MKTFRVTWDDTTGQHTRDVIADNKTTADGWLRFRKGGIEVLALRDYSVTMTEELDQEGQAV